jgi:hypothetical protein
MTYIFKLINFIVLLAIGVLYVEGLKFSMAKYISVFGDAYSTLTRMSVTGTATLLSLIVIFVGNKFITKQNFKWLGLACGFVALIYFYQVHPKGNLLVNITMNFFYIHSAAAFFFFTICPVLLGTILNKKMLLDGLQPPQI